MKYKDNYGADSSTLNRGYSDTGAIPEIGENIFNPESETRKTEMLKMHEMYGMEESEDYSGGFLERQNTDDRM